MDDILEFGNDDKQTPLRVLIVEDNLEDVFFARHAINRILPEAKIAYVDGIGDAYKVCRHYAFDLVLLDLNLPDGFGPSSVQEVKQFVKNSSIFVLTGLASPLTIQQVLEKGAAKLFMKNQLSSNEFKTAILELSAASAGVNAGSTLQH